MIEATNFIPSDFPNIKRRTVTLIRIYNDQVHYAVTIAQKREMLTQPVGESLNAARAAPPAQFFAFSSFSSELYVVGPTKFQMWQ